MVKGVLISTLVISHIAVAVAGYQYRDSKVYKDSVEVQQEDTIKLQHKLEKDIKDDKVLETKIGKIGLSIDPCVGSDMPSHIINLLPIGFNLEKTSIANGRLSKPEATR